VQPFICDKNYDTINYSACQYFFRFLNDFFLVVLTFCVFRMLYMYYVSFS